MKAIHPITQAKKLSTPWVILLSFVLIIIFDWLYIFAVQIHFEITYYSLSLFFPVISFFYFEFSTVAVVGVYLRKTWGFNIAYIMLMTGSSICSVAYLAIFRINFFLDLIFIPILVANLIVCASMICYSVRHKMNKN